MVGFLVKKWFFDLWDNLLAVIIVNLGCIAVLAVPMLLPSVTAPAGNWAGWVTLVAGIVLAFVFLGGVAGAAREWSYYRNAQFRPFLTTLRHNALFSATVAAVVMAHAALVSVAFPFYSALGNALGLFAIAVLFWISVAWVLSLQYLFALRAEFDHPFGKTLKKSLIIMFDNLGFSIALLVFAAVLTLLSTVTVFLIPGPAGVALLYAGALKVRLLKYDYLEEHPDQQKAIPWDTILYDERERVGKRTLRGMIFPWRD